jgi:hypothetical protein
VWKRQRPSVPEEITSRVDEVQAEQTHFGKAKVVAGYAVNHFIALVASVTGLVFFALGALLVAIGVFWRWRQPWEMSLGVAVRLSPTQQDYQASS